MSDASERRLGAAVNQQNPRDRAVTTDPIPCRDSANDPDDWFAPPGSVREMSARLKCMSCPLYWDCQMEALEQGIPHGTWGGQDEKTRHRIWKQRGGMPRAFSDGITSTIETAIRAESARRHQESAA